MHIEHFHFCTPYISFVRPHNVINTLIFFSFLLSHLNSFADLLLDLHDVLQMGDRVGPVGTGEASSSLGASGGTQRLSPVDWTMALDRQEALVSTYI